MALLPDRATILAQAAVAARLQAGVSLVLAATGNIPESADPVFWALMGIFSAIYVWLSFLILRGNRVAIWTLLGVSCLSVAYALWEDLSMKNLLPLLFVYVYARAARVARTGESTPPETKVAAPTPPAPAGSGNGTPPGPR